MLSFVPGPQQLGLQVRVLRHDQQRVRTPQLQYAYALATVGDVRHRAVDRQNQRQFGITGGTLGHEIEVPKLHYLIAPELHPHGLGHAESVDIENAATQAELGHLFYRGDTLETNRRQVLGDLRRPADVAATQFETSVHEGARQTCALQNSSRCGEQYVNVAPTQSLQRLHPLAGHLGVRLDLAIALPRRIEQHADIVGHHAKVGQPSLSLREAFSNDGEKTAGMAPSDRRDEERIAGPYQPTNPAELTRPWQAFVQSPVGSLLLQFVEQQR